MKTFKLEDELPEEFKEHKEDAKDDDKEVAPERLTPDEGVINDEDDEEEDDS